MRTYNSPYFGDIPEPETFQELIDLTVETKGDSERIHVRFWRGQVDADWKLDSAARRRIRDGGSFGATLEAKIVNYEGKLRRQARHQGYDRAEGRELSDLELFGRLQHYGAATRLIDFSKNMAVAAWFACDDENHKDTHGVLFGLSCNHVWPCHWTQDECPLDNKLIHEIADESGENTAVAWDPPPIAGRISAQHSFFVFSRMVDRRWGSLDIAEDDDLLCIAISPRFKVQLREVLTQTFNLSTMTLFPDIEGFAGAHGPAQSTRSITRW